MALDSFEYYNCTSLENFLQEWENNYIIEISKINLFNSSYVKNWTKFHQEEFVKIFYHIRGHFHDFMWYLGNHSNSKAVKKIILDNISEEFNSSAKSHEQLYLEFASAVNVNLDMEFIEGKYYLPFIKEFNQGHLLWLSKNDENSRIGAFSAYEKLDNIDYKNLLEIVNNFNIKKTNFFKVHIRANHFESTYNLIQNIWHSNPKQLIESFCFITNHQITLWKNTFHYLSELNAH